MHSRTTPFARLVAVAVVALFGITACSSDNDGSGSGNGNGNGNGNGSGNGPMQVGEDGTSNFDGTALSEQLAGLPIAELTDTELAGLAQMREEEKLAHDVYATLGDQWGLRVFSNIAASESTHTAAVKTLLDRYGLADPSDGLAAGEFSDPAMQSLYDTLVAQGSESLVAALTVGATIEDLDIADLQTLATDTPDIALVYANLEKGSRNHLRAFTKQLDKNGATYTPAHITQEQYEAIIDSDMERGSGG